jgi:hypothetical protein
VADLIDVELFPSMRCPALTLTANLKTEQALDVTSNPVVVRLDDSGASGFIDELDEMLAADCVHEFVIHGFVHTAKREAFDKAQNRALFLRSRRWFRVAPFGLRYYNRLRRCDWSHFGGHCVPFFRRALTGDQLLRN